MLRQVAKRNLWVTYVASTGRPCGLLKEDLLRHKEKRKKKKNTISNPSRLVSPLTELFEFHAWLLAIL